MHAKILVVVIGLLSVVGCGPSAEEKEEISYEEGYMEALKCVEREGGEAEDAADYCERRM